MFLVQNLKNHLLNEAQRLSECVLPQYIHGTTKIASLQLLNTAVNHTFLEEEKKISCPTKDEFPESFFYTDPDKSKVLQIDQQIEKLQNRIAVVSNAGVGKTTFFKSLLSRYAKHKNLYGFEFVFYINCSYVNFDNRCNPLKFFVRNLPYLWIDSIETSSKVLEELEGKMCILFDNLSYADMCFDAMSPIEHLKTERIFLTKILKRDLHEKDKVLVSLRPLVFNKFINLMSSHKFFWSKVYIQGLSNYNQTEICKFHSKNNCDEIMKYIQAYPNLASFCSVTSNFYAVMHTLNKFITSAGTSFSSSLICFPRTRIFVPSLMLVLWSHGFKHNKCNLHDVIKLAWNEFQNQHLAQIGDALHDLTTDSKLADIFFEILPKEPSTDSFTISIVNIASNFFAAVHLLYMEKSQPCFNNIVLQYINPEPETNQPNVYYKEITRFLYGLCNKSITKYLEKLLPGHYCCKTADVQLKQHITDTLNNLPADSEKIFSVILSVCSLVFEMHDDQFAAIVADFLPDFITVTSSNNTSTSEIAGLAYVLSKRMKKPIRIFLKGFDIFKANKDLFELAKENFQICFNAAN